MATVLALTPIPDYESSPASAMSDSPSPDYMAPRTAQRYARAHQHHSHHHHHQHHHHTPLARLHHGQVFKTDNPHVEVPPLLSLGHDDQITFDAPRWSELMTFCVEHGDSAVRTLAPAHSYADPSSSQLHVCVWEVGEYGNTGADADLSDPLYFRIEMTLKLRSHARHALSPHEGTWSSLSSYSDDDDSDADSESQSPTLSVSSTPPLSAGAGDSSSPSPYSGDWTPDTTPQSPGHINFPTSPAELMPGAALLFSCTSPDEQGANLKAVDKEAVVSVAEGSAGSSEGSAPAATLEVKTRGPGPQVVVIPERGRRVAGHLRRTLMLSFAVQLPAMLGQIGLLARQSSVGEGVDWI